MNLLRFGIPLTLLCVCAPAGIADRELMQSSAVDVQGRRHVCERGRPGTSTPWLADRVAAVGPEYPLIDRARGHEGRGMFRIMLDPKTGRVMEVTVINSTGFQSLDKSVIAALRKWRWKPDRWKEIDMPVTFEMKRK